MIVTFIIQIYQLDRFEHLSVQSFYKIYLLVVSYHRKPKSIRVIIRIDSNDIISIDPGPAFNGWSDRGLAIKQKFFFYSPGKLTADNTFVNKFFSFFQF